MIKLPQFIEMEIPFTQELNVDHSLFFLASIIINTNDETLQF